MELLNTMRNPNILWEILELHIDTVNNFLFLYAFKQKFIKQLKRERKINGKQGQILSYLASKLFLVFFSIL